MLTRYGAVLYNIAYTQKYVVLYPEEEQACL